MKSWRDNPIYQPVNPPADPPADPPATVAAQVDDPRAKGRAYVEKLLAAIEATDADQDSKAGARSWVERFRRAVEAGTDRSWLTTHDRDLRQALARAGHLILRSDDELLDGHMLYAALRQTMAGAAVPVSGPHHDPETLAAKAPTPKQEQMPL